MRDMLLLNAEYNYTTPIRYAVLGESNAGNAGASHQLRQQHEQFRKKYFYVLQYAYYYYFIYIRDEKTLYVARALLDL